MQYAPEQTFFATPPLVAFSNSGPDDDMSFETCRSFDGYPALLRYSSKSSLVDALPVPALPVPALQYFDSGAANAGPNGSDVLLDSGLYVMADAVMATDSSMSSASAFASNPSFSPEASFVSDNSFSSDYSFVFNDLSSSDHSFTAEPFDYNASPTSDRSFVSDPSFNSNISPTSDTFVSENSASSEHPISDHSLSADASEFSIHLSPSNPTFYTNFRADVDMDAGHNSGLSLGAGMAGEIYVGLGGVGVQSGGSGTGGPGGSRLPGACTHCKKLKMKCDFPKGDNTCKRCKTGGHVCIVEGRKPRTAPNKREYLLAQIRQKDAIIESLLKQLHNPYIATPLSIASYRMATSPSDTNNRNIIAWLDRLQSSVQSAGGKGGASAFMTPRSGKEGDDDDSEPETDAMVTNNPPGKDDDSATLDGNDGSLDTEKLQSSLPDTHVPLGLIADLSLDGKKTRSSSKKDPSRLIEEEENYDDDDVGIANETYFMPGPATDLAARANLIERHSPPEILVHGLVAPEDVDKLFDIFYTRVNPFISLLDPVLHTPALTFARCPFLFTVICAVSSRYYSEKSEIYPIAMHFAKHSAANALIDGWKSVELCQAYILMSIFAVPARRWEEDRSWLYTGLAIRIATDLNLHHVSTVKPQTEKMEREILNKTRVWMICFNLDRSTATQFGKPVTIKEDHIMRNSKEWYKGSTYNHPYDVHLCAYTALLRIVARFHEEIFSDPDSPTGLNKRVDFRTVTMTHEEHLTAYHEEWSKRFAEDSDPSDPGCAFRCLLLPFLVEYSRLVMFSFGFQQAFQRGIEAGDQYFFSKCLDSAKGVIRNMIERLAPSGYMRFAPDGHFVFASFASAFLLKLLRPEFSQLLPKEQENEIFDLIGRLIQTLSSPEIAIDDRHTPRLYARFLAGLLSRHRRDGATVGRLHTQPPPTQQISMSNSDFASGSGDSSSASFAQPQGGSQSNQEGSGGFSINTFAMGTPATGDKPMTSTPVYRPEATFSASTGPIQFGGDFDMLLFGTENQVSEEEMLATMQALKNPGWWQNMMMPGFSWPEPSPPPVESPPSLIHNVPGLHSTGFGAMQQVPLH